jgi:hypothetical protein
MILARLASNSTQEMALADRRIVHDGGHLVHCAIIKQLHRRRHGASRRSLCSIDARRDAYHLGFRRPDPMICGRNVCFVPRSDVATGQMGEARRTAMAHVKSAITSGVCSAHLFVSVAFGGKKEREDGCRLHTASGCGRLGAVSHLQPVVVDADCD